VVVELQRHESGVTVEFEKEGFEPEQRQLGKTLSRWLWVDALVSAPFFVMALYDRTDSAEEGLGDFLAVGTTLLTFGIDFTTGAAFTFPRVMRAELVATPERDRVHVPKKKLGAPVSLGRDGSATQADVAVERSGRSVKGSLAASQRPCSLNALVRADVTAGGKLGSALTNGVMPAERCRQFLEVDFGGVDGPSRSTGAVAVPGAVAKRGEP